MCVLRCVLVSECDSRVSPSVKEYSCCANEHSVCAPHLTNDLLQSFLHTVYYTGLTTWFDGF